MFKKILVADDYESYNLSVEKVLKDLEISDATFVNYCDDAYARINTGVAVNQPYDLLITDISFEEDYRTQNLKNGLELISAVKQLSPEIKILVFSVEKKSEILVALFKENQIDAVVSKGRGDAKELNKALKLIFKNEKFISSEHLKRQKENTVFELSTVEIEILKLLSTGIIQKNIPEYLQKKGLKPNSLSAVEKSLNHLKESFSATNNEQLIAICKDREIL